MILAPEMALAQLGARAPASTSVATQLPLSGRSANSGSVATTQTPIPGATTSVNTINTTVQVSGPFAGSSPSDTPFSGKLSFNEAIQRGLAVNLGAMGQDTTVQQARGQAKVARSNLLPNLTGAFSEHYLTTDLATTGIRSAISSSFGSSFGGRAPVLPSVVGPINYYDLRVTLTQNFLDLTLLNNYRSSRDVVRANEALMQDARDTVVLAVGASYLQVIAAKARATRDGGGGLQTDRRAARHGPGGAVGRESGSGARADRAAASGDDGERFGAAENQSGAARRPATK
jgi:outer membrane protein TolC